MPPRRKIRRTPRRTLAERAALKALSSRYKARDFQGLLRASHDLLALAPKDPVALRARAVAYLNLGDPRAAAACLIHAAGPDATDAEAASLLGLARLRLGDVRGGREALEAARRIDPRYAPAWANLGSLAGNEGRHGEAIKLLRRAVRLDPDLENVRIDLARALMEQGRKRSALKVLQEGAMRESAGERLFSALGHACSLLDDRTGELGAKEGELAAAFGAVAKAPRSVEAQHRLGALLRREGRFAEALVHFQRARRLAPQDIRLICCCVECLARLDRRRAARAMLGRARSRWPTDVMLLCAQASFLMEERAYARALAVARRAVAIDASNSVPHSAVGAALFAMGRLDEADEAYRKALALSPNEATCWNAIGLVHGMRGRLMEAARCYKKGLQLDPHNASCLFSLGLTALSLGDWESGWPLYEWRWLGSSLNMHLARPHVPGVAWWTGEPLAGKTLLVLGEQGHGDNIQFVRLIRHLEGPARIVLSMAPPLQRLMALSLADTPVPVELVVRDNAPPPSDADAFTMLLTLPARMGLTQDTLPPFEPWLKPDVAQVEAWRSRLAADPRPKVGFVWRGNPDLSSDRWRSTKLESWAPLLRRREVQWVSLQKMDGAPTAEREILAGHAVVDWTDELNDFADTAALIEALDLVLAVDTSVAHVAGALGKPFWLLNRTGGEWRWGAGQTRNDWYPTARIFNQKQLTQWDPVLAHVARELGGWIRERASV